MQLSKVIHEYRGLSTSPSLRDNDPIRILHLSDLQFGGVDRSRLSVNAVNRADKVIDDWQGQGPTFIAITGDIAEHGLPLEYRAAEKWLAVLTKRFEGFCLPSDRILLVLGNHDVCLPFAAAPRIEINKNKTLTFRQKEDNGRAELRTHALLPYLEFALKTSSAYSPPAWI